MPSTRQIYTWVFSPTPLGGARSKWGRRDLAILGCTLLFALSLWLPVLEWGLPPAIPEVAAAQIRCSYAFDEDDILTAASFTRPERLDFDVRVYRWGTFHLHLTQVLLDGAEALGYFRQPWRASYYNMVPGEFERVYALARTLSAVFGLLLVAAVYLLGFEVDGRRTAFWTAAITAASPVQLLASTQIRADVTMAALAVLAAWLGLRSLRVHGSRTPFAFGLVCGLALAAKYSALLVISPMLIVVLHAHRFARGIVLIAIAGFGAGVLIGEPYVFARWPEIVRQVSEAAGVNRQIPERFAISIPELLWAHAANVSRFVLGPIAAALCLAGLWLIVRQKMALILAALAGSVLTLIPLRWPLLRYALLLLPWLALAAGLALARLNPRLQWPLGIVSLIFALAASLAQIHYMRSPHPANTALHTILRAVPPGTPIARPAAELPPLDRKVYPMGLTPLLDDLTVKPPEWVITTDLPDTAYTTANIELLAAQYSKVGSFRSHRIFSWATLGEAGAPHDWKYTHPAMTLYYRPPR